MEGQNLLSPAGYLDEQMGDWGDILAKLREEAPPSSSLINHHSLLSSSANNSKIRLPTDIMGVEAEHVHHHSEWNNSELAWINVNPTIIHQKLQPNSLLQPPNPDLIKNPPSPFSSYDSEEEQPQQQLGKTTAEAQLPPLKKSKQGGGKKERGPRFAIRTCSQVDVIDDGYKWRKYGQKPVKNSPYSRSYYRCTEKQCGVKKQVERHADDGAYVVTTYEGVHTHPSPAPIDLVPYMHHAQSLLSLNFPLALHLQQLQSAGAGATDIKDVINTPMQQSSNHPQFQGLLDDNIPSGSKNPSYHNSLLPPNMHQ